MKQIITIASHKGGVGKTTTALNLAFAMSRLRPGVLVVDMDVQGALGIAGNIKRKNKLGLMDLLMERATPSQVITHTKDGQMAMVGMGTVEIDEMYRLEELAATSRLGELLSPLFEGFPMVFLDAPAGVGPVTRSLLALSTGVIMPINAKNTTSRSIPIFLKMLETIKADRNPGLIFEGLVITMLDYANSHEIAIRRDLLQTLPPGIMFNSFIIHNPKYEEASLKGVPIALLNGGQEAARGYMNLAMEYLSRKLEREHKGEEHVEELF